MPLQLVLQIASKQKISNLMAAADDADILFHAEPSTLDYLTVCLTSFEKNAGKSIYCNSFIRLYNFNNLFGKFRSSVRTRSRVSSSTKEFYRRCLRTITMDRFRNGKLIP